jgi:hypothetical protein
MLMVRVWFKHVMGERIEIKIAALGMNPLTYLLRA